MAKDWIERANGAFNAQARSFSKTISADFAGYAISAGEAAQLAAEYADFAAMIATTSDPSTRTSIAVSGRNMSRAVLAAHMRDIAARVRANSTIGTAAKLALGLTVPGARDAAPTGSSSAPPAMRPSVNIRSIVSNRVTVRLANDEQTRFARPPQVQGAEVFFAVADEPPVEAIAWRRGALTMSSKATFTLPVLPAGTTVWIAARWFNSRGQPGPLSQPVQTFAAGGVTLLPSLAA